MRLQHFLLLFFTLLCAHAHAHQEKDSLLKKLDGLHDHHKRMDVLQRLAEIESKDAEVSREYLLKGLKVAVYLKDTKRTAEFYHLLGMNYAKVGDLDKAISKFNEAIHLAELKQDHDLKTSIINDLGDAYFQKGYLDQALKLYSEVLESPASTRLSRWDHAHLLNNIANVYQQLHQHDVAREYYDQSLRDFLTIRDTIGVAIVYSNVGMMYYELGELDSALLTFQRSAELYRASDDKRGLARVICNSGLVYEDRGNLSLALATYTRALKYADESQDQLQAVLAILNIANVYLLQHEYELAKEHALQALDRARQLGSIQYRRNAYQLLYEISEGLGKTDEALQYLKEYGQLKDSLLSEEQVRSLSEMQIRYESEKRQLELETLKHKSDLQEAELQRRQMENDQKQWENYLLIFGILFAAAIVIILVFLYLRNKEISTQLEHSVGEKEVLIKEIHHRVKNNFQVVSSLINLQSGNVDPNNPDQAFRDIRSRIDSMALVHKKLYMSDDYTSIDYQDYLEQLVDALKQGFSDLHNVDVELQVEHIFLHIEQAIPLGIIVNELVTNAYKYAFPDHRAGHILISFKMVGKEDVVLTVQDDGVGLPPDFQAEESGGLGMELVSILTEQLNGTLSIESQNGATFTVRFAPIR